MKTWQWGIIGTGEIAHQMGDTFKKRNQKIYGVAGSSLEKSQQFAAEYAVINAFENYQALLADDQIQIVYIATPHNTHYEMIKAALNAGKHVFCEKAITVNATQLAECVAIAKAKDLVISDGTTLLHMPLYRQLAEMIKSGQLGALKMIQVSFGSAKTPDANNRFFSPDLAGGALLDIGVYAVSFARFFMSCQPQEILTTVKKFATGVDESSGIILKNENDEMAVISLTMRAKQPKKGVIACENGYIEVADFPRATSAKLTDTITGEVSIIEAGDSADTLLYEVLDMENYIQEAKGQDNLAMVQDVMQLLTNIRQQWGLKYPFE